MYKKITDENTKNSEKLYKDCGW